MQCLLSIIVNLICGILLQGATPMDQTSIPQGCEQIFVISEDVSNTQKEDLAWATYILLRNTNTISVVHGRFL